MPSAIPSWYTSHWRTTMQKKMVAVGRNRTEAVFAGSVLRGIREEMGLRQGQLAEKMGVERKTVCRWENDVVPFSRMRALSLLALASRHAKSLGQRVSAMIEEGGVQ